MTAVEECARGVQPPQRDAEEREMPKGGLELGSRRQLLGLCDRAGEQILGGLRVRSAIRAPAPVEEVLPVVAR